MPVSFSRFASLVLALVALCAQTACPPNNNQDAGTQDDAGSQNKPLPSHPHTPAWAFEPWISKDISDGPDTYAFVDGFQERNIPVGVVVLDSPWETNYNTFIVNEERYPNFSQMIKDFREDDIRVILWTTQMLNESSFDLESGGDVYNGPADNLREASQKDFLVDDGTTYFWWKGTGAGIDFFNPDAVDWWHNQYKHLLDLGVAGFKLDFGEQYLPETIQTAIGEVSRQEYSEAYYRDFWEYGVSTVGEDEFVTMVRPYDESYGFDPRFYARPEHAPVGWVGDQFRNEAGIRDALDHIFRSAEKNYVTLGGDIGGYLDNNIGQDIAFDRTLFHRWVALSAFFPLFQLHGRANLAPWTIDGDDEFFTAESVFIYRYYATLHHVMVPYWYSLAEAGHEDKQAILHPVGTEEVWPDDYRFIVGDAFFVAPLLDGDESLTPENPVLPLGRSVVLPEHTNTETDANTNTATRWYDWWHLTNPSIAGGTTIDATFDTFWKIPVFVKSGAILPLNLDQDVFSVDFGIGIQNETKDAYTVLVVADAQASSFVLREDRGLDDDAALSITQTLDVANNTVILELDSKADSVPVFDIIDKPLHFYLRADDVNANTQINFVTNNTGFSCSIDSFNENTRLLRAVCTKTDA